mmetsp:Transcript_9497/g.13566  ORF Transcript_9497/g.13566 Transcript_9497/m.13566 type:complete len:80 (+) Transcript_9497:286-525(+)
MRENNHEKPKGARGALLLACMGFKKRNATGPIAEMRFTIGCCSSACCLTTACGGSPYVLAGILMPQVEAGRSGHQQRCR